MKAVEMAIRTIVRGGIIIVVDDPDRENEGDFVAAASLATASTINFMATYGRGLICCAIERAQLDRLNIPPMTASNIDTFETAFHTGVDHRGSGTGISATDRARTVVALANQHSVAGDFRMPGHVFPLAANPGGVFARRGHTEASVDIVRLAGLPPAGLICEIADENGEMANLPSLEQLARKFQLPLITIQDLAEYQICLHSLLA
jgi:3,4-dihydroxy 2-butanone 4-phosphate synthase / GTP cyclohydrolase II